MDIAHETLLSLSQAARRLPPGRGGRPMHMSGILRWVLEGAKAPDGSRVRLEAMRLGGRWLTSVEALQRFGEALTPRLDDDRPTIRTPTQRSRAAERAARELEALGV